MILMIMMTMIMMVIMMMLMIMMKMMIMMNMMIMMRIMTMISRDLSMRPHLSVISEFSPSGPSSTWPREVLMPPRMAWCSCLHRKES